MTKTQLLQKLIPLSVFFVSIFSIIGYIELKTGIPVANTTFWWLIQAGVLFVFFLGKSRFFKKNQVNGIIVVQWYLLWNAFSCLRGTFIAENYWDWKGLVGVTMALFIPLVAYVASNIVIVQSILIFYIKYTLPLFVIIFFLIATDAYGFYLVPISFLLLFFPALTLRWKIVMLIIAILVITADLGARSNVIKFTLPALFSLLFYIRLLLSNAILELIRKSLFIAPIILFSLAVTDVFNVFKMDDYIKSDIVEIKKDAEGNIYEDNLKADTRSSIYIDVLNTAEDYNSWWIGRSPARGNKSESFGEWDESGRGERLGNEVAIANIFTWTGIVGVVLYFLVFYKASYLAINQSNNFFAKILGLFLAFRWLYAWVEDINNFSLTTFFLWFMIGLCFSKSFRIMTDQEVKHWVRGIFDKRYVVVHPLQVHKI